MPPNTSYFVRARQKTRSPAEVQRRRYLEMPSKGTSRATSSTIVSMACSRTPWRFCAPDWPPSLWESLTAVCEMPASVSTTEHCLGSSSARRCITIIRQPPAGCVAYPAQHRTASSPWLATMTVEWQTNVRSLHMRSVGHSQEDVEGLGVHHELLHC
jgi:hypothetical protein